MEVRQVIQCLSTTSPEEFDLVSAQLEQALEERREAMGNHTTRMEWEARDALRQARHRLRQDATDAVRRAIAQLASATPATLPCLREEISRTQSQMAEWLGSQLDVLQEEAKAALQVAERSVQQQAVQVVRRVSQHLVGATPENLSVLREQLEKTLAEQASHLGGELARAQEEVASALDVAQRQVTDLLDRRAIALREVERLKNASRNLAAEVSAAEAEAQRAAEAFAKASCEEESLSPEDALQATKLCEEALTAVRQVLLAANGQCQQIVGEVAAAASAAAAARAEVTSFGPGVSAAGLAEVEAQIQQLSARLTALGTSLDDTLERAKAGRERAGRRATAARREKEQRELFDRYDADGDQALSRAEIEVLAKEEYDIDFRDDFHEKIRTALGAEAVVYDKFARLRQMLAIERSEVKARAKRAEEEERSRREKEEAEQRQRELEERTAAVQALLREAHSSLPDASAALAGVEVESSELLVGEERFTSAELLEAAATTEGAMRRPGSALEAVRAKLDKAIKMLGNDLGKAFEAEVVDLRVRLERAEARVSRLQLAIRKARDKAKDVAEKEARLTKQRQAFAKLQRTYDEEQEDEDDDSGGEWQS